MIEVLIVIGAIAFVTPCVVYISVKLATVAFYNGRSFAEKRIKKENLTNG